ncbi:MAG TPA: hypothetical protein ENK16_03670 [Chromatiales bacterium]|nr:hypothetical protein [Chromatiales bacterium]
MPTLLLSNGALTAIAVTLLVLLLRPALRNARFWRATVTPLASIVGSGFLVVAPLLAHIAGKWAALAMSVVVLLAYAIGSVIRFNIRHAEPLLAEAPPRLLVLTETLSKVLLSVAYLISVAFYIRLLSAFVLRSANMASENGARILTTIILAFIGIHGWRRGLSGLERLEEYSVTVKLSIIGALLAGLAGYDFAHGFRVAETAAQLPGPVEVLRLLAGTLLVVQGFETSRYLGLEYSAAIRVRSMRAAQWISGLIYVIFILLATPLLKHLPPGETAIMDLAAEVAQILPAMLVLAAIMSQFSAAVADTLGGGGLLVEQTRGRIRAEHSYLLIALCAMVLVWSANVFEIITLASRAFAAYYLCQALVALQTSHKLENRVPHWRCYTGFGALALILLLIVVFAIPAG